MAPSAPLVKRIRCKFGSFSCPIAKITGAALYSTVDMTMTPTACLYDKKMLPVDFIFRVP